MEQVPELPSLDPGMTLLDSEDRVGPLQSLVVDHVLGSGGRVYWVDVGGHATTKPMARLAGPRVLDRVEVARAFTPHQHYSIVESLAEDVRRGEVEPSLVVAPAVDALYEDDAVGGRRAERMLRKTVARLYGAASTEGAPLLVSTESGSLARHVRSAADDVVRCRSTPMGARFVSSDFDTLVYHGRRGMQTTFAFWRRVLEARSPVEIEPAAEPAGGRETGGMDLVNPVEPVEPMEVDAVGTH